MALYALPEVTNIDQAPRIFTYLAVLSAARKAQGERLPRYCKGNELPSIDIFVTYCGEGLSIISDTVKACCALDYPQALYRVIVLDDSHSAELQGVIAEHRKQHPNLHYASRNVEVSTHSKAANMNFGLQIVESLPGGKADYVAVLDVDMIPMPEWLRVVLPHVHDNPHVGLSCPIQNFYNLPVNDPISTSYDVHSVHCILALNDYSNTAFCTGSGFVARRSALDSIGGFPESSMQEDFLTSLHLAANGWETVFLVKDHVQWGLMPDTFAGWVKQRQRWGAGVISIAQYMCSREAQRLPREARLNGAMWGIVDVSGTFVWTVALVGLPLLVMTQQPLLAWGGPTQAMWLVGLAFFDFAAQCLTQILLSSLLDFRRPIMAQFASIWIAPYRLAVAWRFYVLPRLLGHKTPNFTPTNGLPHGAQERAARTQGSLTTRLKVLLWDCGAYLHLMIVALCIAGGFLVSRSVMLDLDTRGTKWALQRFVSGIGWPPLFVLWAAFFKNALVPVIYALSPPALLPREHFLLREGKDGVAYPKPQAKADHIRRTGQGFFYFACLYYVGILIAYGLA